MTLQVSKDIITLAHFKAHASELINTMKTHQRSLVITQNGVAAAVILTPEEYDLLRYQADFRAKVAKGLEQSRLGETMSHDEMVAEMGHRYGGGPSDETE